MSNSETIDGLISHPDSLYAEPELLQRFDAVVGPDMWPDDSLIRTLLEQTQDQDEAPPVGEVYAKSLRVYKALGEVALGETIDGGEGVVVEGWTDFITALEENIATDPEFGEVLTFDRMRSMPYIDGRVTAMDGTPMSELVGSGRRASEIAAKENPNMGEQVRRDESDEFVVAQVDNLKVGEMAAFLSMDPKEGFAVDPQFWKTMGYREGMAVLQVYFRTSDTELLCGSFKVNHSNKQALSEMITRIYGTAIPEDTHSSQWIRYGMYRKASEQEARSFGKDFQQNYLYQIRDNRPIYSVTEFLQGQHDKVVKHFDIYARSLAKAAYSEKNNEVMSGLARSILDTVPEMPAEEKRLLHEIQDSVVFTDEYARIMEEKMRYALIESLRGELKKYVTGPRGSEPAEFSEALHYQPTIKPEYEFFQRQQLEAMHMQAAHSIRTGTVAGRSYGGCASAGGGEKERDAFGVLAENSSQNIFGGALGNQEDDKITEDEFGSLEFTCTEGHWNTRSPHELISRCRFKQCKGRVCAPKEPEPKPSKSPEKSGIRWYIMQLSPKNTIKNEPDWSRN